MRPDFSGHNAGWQERMVIRHSYGKNCTALLNSNALTCAGLPCPVGHNMVQENGRVWEDADAVQCPDRTDCENVNLDFLVMAGFFCHPCLPNPCMNHGVCANTGPRIGFQCWCPDNYWGGTCEKELQVEILTSQPQSAVDMRYVVVTHTLSL